MIKISNLTFGYSRKKILFQDLNLQMQEGHIYGLLGKNGAGKSTLLKNIAGLVFPQQGVCEVNGFDSSKRLPAFLQDLFFIPEEVYMPALTAAQFIKSTGHFYPAFDEKQFNQMLDEFDVPADTLLNKLSFGQQKKVIIAFGLSTNTSLLIMDEPTNGLDIPSKSQFRKIIASALTENRCIIISTHQVRDLDNLIDTVLVVHQQKIILNKSLDEISEELKFSTVATVGSDVLYAEESVRGMNTITQNTNGSYSKVDLELLFNAIINDKNTITEILNR
ncbi:ABC transporter ATP-binding protein [Mucilaginibacter arboris]|uniref:ATP-binding cassette domain-containing protein n=1 Tax=Mucilaginibacter arboris TaxID=2682090 RepID=A0A7K1SY81_9SPHI|nr:ABC transporter ATP-binding protein [Mucilaginibacter arboris]MVN22207.1 ATP-binding cassette domain-containing protein [Mucilaginibacter arboris]